MICNEESARNVVVLKEGESVFTDRCVAMKIRGFGLKLQLQLGTNLRLSPFRFFLLLLSCVAVSFTLCVVVDSANRCATGTKILSIIRDFSISMMNHDSSSVVIQLA